MRVAVYRNNHDLRIEERPRPVPGPGELLMRVAASGICGSDLLEWYRVPKAPLVLGHEVSGTVEEIGPGITTYRLGGRIVTTHHVPCGECRYCRADRHSVCDRLRTTSFDPGGFSEFVRLPEVNVRTGTFHLPESVSFEAASFVEPLACVIRGQRMARLASGQAVAILGSGISGLLHLLTARALGVGAVVTTDVHPYRLGAARALGADAAVDAREDVPAAIRNANRGRLADCVIVTTAAPAAIAQSFRCVDRGGTILFFAPTPPGQDVPVPLWDVWHDGVILTTSYSGPPEDMRAALELIAAGAIDVDPLVTHRLGLAEIAHGFELMERGTDSLKIIIEPGR